MHVFDTEKNATNHNQNIYLYRKQGEKIGCETGSSKFQLLEKDY